MTGLQHLCITMITRLWKLQLPETPGKLELAKLGSQRGRWELEQTYITSILP